MKPIKSVPILVCGALALFGFLAELQALPKPLYFSQNGSGTKDGSSPSNSQTITWVNAGNIPANWTVSVVGLVTEFNVQANGETVLIPGGSGVSTANSTGIYVNPGVSGLTIDGNGGGFIACTANGSTLAHQTGVYAIQCGGEIAGLSVKNLAITNIYVMSSPMDPNNFTDGSGAIWANGVNGSNFFGNLYCSDCSTAIQTGGAGTCVYSNCTFIRCNHDLFPSSDSTVIENCYFGTGSNWDQVNNNYHHDSIIWLGGNPSTLFVLRGCVFNGDMGIHNTAYLFINSGYARTMLIYNNFWRVWPGNHLNNGVFCGGGVLLNNTFIDASGIAGGNTCITFPSQNNTIQNNLFVNFSAFLIMVGSTYGNNFIRNNVYAGAAGTASWQACGNVYKTFASWQSYSGDALSSYSTGTSWINPNNGVVTPSYPGAGAGNTNAYAVGVTSDLYGNQRLPSTMDVGAVIVSNSPSFNSTWMTYTNYYSGNGVTTNAPSTNGPSAWFANLQALAILPGGSGPVQTSTNSQSPAGSASPTNVLNGLVAWWTLDDLSGADSSGNGKTLAFVASPTSTSGPVSNGIALNGSSQYGVIGSAPVTADPFTVTTWFKTTATNGVIVGLFNDTVANWNGYFMSVSSGAICGHTVDSNNFVGAFSPLTYNDGNWHFAATVFTSGQQVLYMDGNTVQTNTTEQVPTGLNEVCIGASRLSGGVTGNFFNGAIDDVRIYNRALSADEIAGQYQWPAGGRP